MGFMRRDIEFPISDGILHAALRVGLIEKGWGTGLTVQPKLPATKTRRMVTGRNDSGPQEGRISFRRYGFNWWADDPVEAQNMALDGMSVLRLLADGDPIAAVDQFAGPFEIDDDSPYEVGSKVLTHFYSTCRVAVKGSTPS